MCHDFTDSYSPHIAIERDLNSWEIFEVRGCCIFNVFVNKFLMYQVLISSTKFSSG